ncbi:MAG: thioesterase family protein [Clostridia bacterium]|nr:thioesterase family protein [Clostridia bacterium]
MGDYIRAVQYYETDKMGIVHHSNYIRWFEEARILYMKDCGYDYRELEDNGIMIPVLGVSAVYKTGVKYGDVVRIKVKIDRITPVKLSFSYEVSDNETGELRTAGTSDHCFVDSRFKPCSIKKKMPEFYEVFSQTAKYEPENMKDFDGKFRTAAVKGKDGEWKPI